MKTRHTTNPKRPTNRRCAHRTLAPERLEQRKLMAADAFEAMATDPSDLALHTQMSRTVDDLAQLVQRQITPDLMEHAHQSGQPMLLMEAVDPAMWQQTVDSAEIPELGQVLGQDPQLAQALTDLVMMDLAGVPNQSLEFNNAMQMFVNELDCQLDLFTDQWALASEIEVVTPVEPGAQTGSDGFVDAAGPIDSDGLVDFVPLNIVTLPPEYEQLRLELGDEGFQRWLETNQHEYGNLSGVPEEVVNEWMRFNPLASERFQTQEQQLQDWLRSSHEANEPAVPSVPTLEGDADLDGVVGFSDFLILSGNFGNEVDVAITSGDFDFDGVVGFSDFLILSGNFGDTIELCGTDSSDANDPKDGTEIQNGGDMTIRAGSRIFISDRTVDGDKRDLTEDAPKDTPIHDGMKSWQDVIDQIKNLPDGSITGDLVLSGHGADGGVGASGSDIDGENLTDEQAAILKKKLGPKSRIVVLGCSQADAEDNDNMQKLADKTGRPVVGNQGGVSDGTNGDGDWFRFDPK